MAGSVGAVMDAPIALQTPKEDPCRQTASQNITGQESPAHSKLLNLCQQQPSPVS